MLEVSHISFAFEGDHRRAGLPVVSEVSFSIAPGLIGAIIGPSGCGKTTLLNLIAGLLSPSSGKISVTSRGQQGRQRAGYVFQSPSLVPWRNVRDNALLGAEMVGPLTSSVHERCRSMLASYGLKGFEDAYPSALSGGMQQRVAVIRAALSGAPIILLDEPFSSSDYLMRRQLRRELSDLVAREGLIGVLVTHDIEEAVRLADKIIILSARPAVVRAELQIPLSRDERLAEGPHADELVLPHLRRVWEMLERPEELNQLQRVQG